MSGSAIVQRGPHSFAVVCYAGIQNGKQRQKKIGGFKSRRDAERYRARLMHHPLYSAGLGPDGNRSLRVQTYLENWISKRETLGVIRPYTAKDYRDLVRLHITPLGHIPLHRLSADTLEAHYVDLIQKGLSAGTVRKVAAIIHAGLRAAVKSNLIMQSRAESVTLPPPSSREAVIWTPAQIRAYLDDAKHTSTPAEFALFSILFGAGTRIGEATGAAEDAFDPQRGVLRVERTLKRAGKMPVFAPPKTKAGKRSIRLPDETVAAIHAAQVWKKKQRLALGPDFHDCGTLLCTPTGLPLDRHALRAHPPRQLKSAAQVSTKRPGRDHKSRIERLGLPYARLHDLRHMHATYLKVSGVDDVTAASRMGHRDPAFLTRTYAHAVAQAQEHAAQVGNELVTNSGRFAETVH